MSRNDILVDDSAVRPQEPTGRRRWPRFAKVGAAVLVGCALFAGGVLVANGLNGNSQDVVSEAANTVVLQRLGVLTQQADAVISQVQQADPADLQTQQQQGVQLQVLAVALDELPAQASDEELRGITQLIADGYLRLSVGIVTNSGVQTTRGAEILAESKQRLEEYLGTPVPAPQDQQPPKKEPKLIEGYELIQRIGEGGIGSVWLVRKPGADRMFVLKIPKREALANASETESAGILASFVEEAAALAGLYHPNVANIIDRGVSDGVPFLVLEYLIGADLQQYSTARRMSLFELRDVVLGACAGLQALHGAGLVHRDIKPANLWLRLPLSRGERFDPQKHRDPAMVPPLATVVIDFGMVRAVHVSSDVAGRFVAGTAGYIAPEQVLDPVELDPRADVYALAGTIYNVTTGRAFFDEIENTRDRIIAHMNRDPFEDPERLKGFPPSMAKLLRGATATKPGDRPGPLEFGRLFAGAL